MTIIGGEQIARGSGRTYAIAQRLLQAEPTCWGLEGASETFEALREVFADRQVMRPARAQADAVAELNAEFDMDGIATFSSAWQRWDAAEAILGRHTNLQPLDAALFSGAHRGAADYSAGIEQLARKNAPRLIGGLKAVGLSKLGGRLLDVGSGKPVYARALLDEGLVDTAVCIDLPYIAARYAADAGDRLVWLPGDAWMPRLQQDQQFDVMLFANLMHHYPIGRFHTLLKRLGGYLAAGARIVVQEYPLTLADKAQLPAAILGLHFLLTTEGGRNYSEHEIATTVEMAIGFRLEQQVQLFASAAFIFSQP